VRARRSEKSIDELASRGANIGSQDECRSVAEHTAAPLAQPTPGSLGAPAPGAAAPQGQAVGVSIAQFAFVPATITISAEQSITWTNNDPVDHTTTVMTRSGTRAS
jgi:plastocyanin